MVERSQQVLLMKEIYQNAAKVLISLDFEETEEILDATYLHSTLALCKIALHRLKVMELDYPKNDPVSFTRDEMAALRRLFGCSWWVRAWVVQEIFFSKAAVFVLDTANHELDWDLLGHASESLPMGNRGDSEKDFPLRSQKNYAQAWKLWALKRTTDPTPLRGLIAYFDVVKATELEDYIYALLSLSAEYNYLGKMNQRSVPVPTIDYSKELSEIYTEWARYFIADSQSLEILCEPLISVGDQSWSEAESKLPSWVPNWSRTVNPLRIEHGDHYAAARSRPVRIGNAIDQYSLNLSGIQWDSIIWVGSTTSENSQFNAAFAQASEFLGSYLTQEGLEVLFALTATAGAYQDKGAGTSTPPNIWTYLTTRISEHLESGDYTLGNDLDEPNRPGQTQNVGWSDEYRARVRLCCFNRRLFITKRGYLGLGPYHMQLADLVCILFGGDTPYILRKSSSLTYRFIGQCYVHGIMNGEVVDEWEKTQGNEQWFELR
ncbi:hypothetical protein H2200_007428 [Cladophialophora chaetospira]|uniref:Heterokaryon incompatibility domain-containing protein n=1 Tax=Cladophialophora chaetospira TaxID=386627 RepID=A0AA39CHP9_9EURO|nr:hypothetical protein H2200_007428 [Cladophialophora chaetospira]